MLSRPDELIRWLELQPHPEGGYYRRIHQSDSRVLRADGQQRLALTSIFYLLPQGSISRWHRVWADEAWHFYEGGGLELFSFADGDLTVAQCRLGRLGDGGLPVRVIPAGHWQAARPLGDYALVGCSVGPGFDFADFTMLADLPAAARPQPPHCPPFSALL